MDQFGTYDTILQYASDLLNRVRQFLVTALNIELPMWVAQAIVLALFLPIVFFSLKRAWKTRKVANRLVAWAASIVTGVVSLVIVATWLTYWRSPLLQQLQGEVSGLTPEMRADTLRVDLLDYRGESLGVRVHWLSGTPQFLLNYEPEFADPPRLIRVKGAGCNSERRPRPHELRRRAVMHISLECSPPS